MDRELIAGIAAYDARERVAAKLALADVTIGEIVDRPVIDPDRDDVSRLCLAQLDQAALAQIKSWPLGALRDHLLSTTNRTNCTNGDGEGNIASGVSEGKYDAAIAAKVAAENYGLEVLNENIGC